jgi:hypothetical protein
VAQPEALRAHVERIVSEYLGVGRDYLEIDADGDIPVRVGSALYFVSLLDRDPALVRVWSIVLDDVKSSDDLLSELNDINANIVAARVFFLGDRVIAATELRADTLDPDELAFACDSIGALSDWIDTTMVVRFGGKTRFNDDEP